MTGVSGRRQGAARRLRRCADRRCTMLARFDRLTLKLTVTIVLFAVLMSAAPAVLVGYGFGQAQQTATKESKTGLESQERSALLRLTPSEAQLSAAPLLRAKRAG